MSHADYVNIGTPETRVIEECSELIKIICKADRFGLDCQNPNLPHTEVNTNRQRILQEIEDVRNACNILEKKMVVKKIERETER